MATKPNHVFTRANIPTINSYCGLNISTETETGSLGPTSTLTPTPPPSTTTWPTKLPPTTPLSLDKAITEEKVLLHAITAMAEQLEQLLNREPNPEPDSGPNPESLTLNHSGELNCLEALILFIFLIIH